MLKTSIVAFCVVQSQLHRKQPWAALLLNFSNREYQNSYWTVVIFYFHHISCKNIAYFLLVFTALTHVLFCYSACTLDTHSCENVKAHVFKQLTVL